MLWELTAYRDAPSAGRPNDSARFEKLGHLGPFIVAGFPLNTPPYPSFDVFLPVDGLLDLLAGPDGVHALRFVAAVRGSDHPVYRAVQELRRG